MKKITYWGNTKLGLTPAYQARIGELFRSGVSVRQISMRLDMPARAIRKILRRQNCLVVTQATPFSAAIQEKISGLYENGLSGGTIARIIGKSPATVIRMVRKHGGTIRSAKPTAAFVNGKIPLPPHLQAAGWRSYQEWRATLQKQVCSTK